MNKSLQYYEYEYNRLREKIRNEELSEKELIDCIILMDEINIKIDLLLREQEWKN